MARGQEVEDSGFALTRLVVGSEGSEDREGKGGAGLEGRASWDTAGEGNGLCG